MIVPRPQVYLDDSHLGKWVLGVVVVVRLDLWKCRIGCLDEGCSWRWDMEMVMMTFLWLMLDGGGYENGVVFITYTSLR